ncbi:MAG: amidohydrolase/deacetylase family metallohydrolase [Cyclobacteriaceae bacterium]|nr:amidohydrolase/deacetylase family metallohydrolase [Cyclobacteriaceae bacterium]
MHWLFTTLIIFVCTTGYSQLHPYDLLIKHGRVIDPASKIDSILDVAIAQGKIVKVGRGIAVTESKKVIDARGLIVAPGFIDIHTHVFVGATPGVFADGIYSVSADDFSFKAGVTTVVDAGTSGWRNFQTFKTNVIDKSQTRILAFLNISGVGMSGDPGQQDVSDMNARETALTIKNNPEVIIGVKVGHFEGSDWTPFKRALEAGTIAKVPMLVECHLPKYSLEDQLANMRPGDIITHAYEKIDERMSVIDERGQVRSYVLQAQKKGVLFDVGHGGYGFWFSEAIPAFQQGLAPNTFGSDLHRFSMNSGMKSMLNIMSKYLNIGMEIPEIITRASWNAAQSIKRPDLGSLRVGSVADIAILSVLQGKFGFVDAGGNKIEGTQKFESELTLREGKIVWDLNGLAAMSLQVKH